MKSLSSVWLLATSWTAAHQAPPSMGFSRQEYRSGCHLLLLEVTMTPSNSVCQSQMRVIYYMYLWLTCYKSRGSHHVSGLNNLLEWLREFRKTCWLTRLPIFYKKDTKIQESIARWRDPRRNHRKRAEPPSPPQTHHFPHSPHVYQLISSPNPRNFITWAWLIIGHWW